MPDKRSLAFHPGPIRIVISDPIETSGRDRADIDGLIDRTRAVVAGALDPRYPD